MKASLHISIKYTGNTYEDSPLGAKIIRAFGRPEGHGVGMGHEDFSYGIAQKSILKALKLAKNIVGRKGTVMIG